MATFLRVDDFPGTKSEEFWKHNLDNFKVFDALLEKHGVESYVLGVIPKYTTQREIDWLSQNPRVIVALHGIEHDERFMNEFRDFETEHEIKNKLLSAKASLRQCNSFNDVIDYIPPHNVVDLKTARALKDAGFTRLHCGPGTDIDVLSQIRNSHLFSYHGVLYSNPPSFYGRSDEMMERGAVPDIKAFAESSALVPVTLHWTWEWNIGLENLDRFLTQVGHVFRGDL